MKIITHSRATKHRRSAPRHYLESATLLMSLDCPIWARYSRFRREISTKHCDSLRRGQFGVKAFCACQRLSTHFLLSPTSASIGSLEREKKKNLNHRYFLHQPPHVLMLGESKKTFNSAARVSFHATPQTGFRSLSCLHLWNQNEAIGAREDWVFSSSAAARRDIGRSCAGLQRKMEIFPSTLPLLLPPRVRADVGFCAPLRCDCARARDFSSLAVGKNWEKF